jgi:hypothetical protein
MRKLVWFVLFQKQEIRLVSGFLPLGFAQAGRFSVISK